VQRDAVSTASGVELQADVHGAGRAEEQLRMQARANRSPDARSTARYASMLNRSPAVIGLQRKHDRLSRDRVEQDEEIALKRDPGAPIQRFGPEEEELFEGERAPLQRLSVEDEGIMQGKLTSPAVQLEAESQPNDTGLPDSLKAGIENLSGVSLDGVRVHYDSPEPAQLSALAYTKGSDIHVAPGQEQHLGHEAWHVVQQMQGRVQATTEVRGAAINDDPALEREADVMGSRASAGG
jgi:hypothetical protein